MQAKCTVALKRATVHANAPNKQKFFASFFQKRSACLSVFLVLFSLPALSQQNPLIGTWQARIQFPEGPGIVTMTISADGQYFQSVQSAGLLTSQDGIVRLLAGGMVAFVVRDWEPKRQCFAPDDCTPIQEPAGGTYTVSFPSPDVLDLRQGGFPPVAFQRVR
jgi:hypothetical protein